MRVHGGNIFLNGISEDIMQLSLALEMEPSLAIVRGDFSLSHKLIQPNKNP